MFLTIYFKFCLSTTIKLMIICKHCLKNKIDLLYE